MRWNSLGTQDVLAWLQARLQLRWLAAAAMLISPPPLPQLFIVAALILSGW